MAVEPAERCVEFDAWQAIYSNVRDYCDFTSAIQFLQANVGATNNRGHSGCTLLHQAVWWDVDKGIIQQLKACGADPTIRDAQGRLAIDMCRTPTKREEMEVVMREVFGEEDAEARLSLLAAAKEGNFVSVMRQLRQQPHLINTQSHRGWSVLHQAVFHGVSQGLIAALLQLGASPQLKTDEGKTAAMILAERHPGSELSLPDRPAAVVAPEAQVVVHTVTQPVSGVVAEVAAEAGTAKVVTADGQEMLVPLWRVCPVACLPDAAEADAGLDLLCSVCYTTAVLPSWQPSASCSGAAHPMCGDCTASFLWSQFTSFKLPMKCETCKAPVDPSGLVTGSIGRTLLRSWPPGHQWGSPCTSLDWRQFLQNVEERLRENESPEYEAVKLQMLAESPPTDHPIAYCDVSGAPKLRACPQCGVIIEYMSDCKHMWCAMCKHMFCFLCLKSEDEHDENDWSFAEVCPIAPIQTVLPRKAA